MSSKKCSICGMTNFGSAVVCKRCHQSLTTKPAISKAQQKKSVLPATADQHRAKTTSGDNSDAQAQRKRLEKIAGALIAVGLLFGLVTALTQEYYYLAVGGPALLIGAFVKVNYRRVGDSNVVA